MPSCAEDGLIAAESPFSVSACFLSAIGIPVPGSRSPPGTPASAFISPPIPTYKCIQIRKTKRGRSESRTKELKTNKDSQSSFRTAA